MEKRKEEGDKRRAMICSRLMPEALMRHGEGSAKKKATISELCDHLRNTFFPPL